jgi:hypothetical protein
MHAMSFNIFIQIELIFTKSIFFFHELISWSLLVVCTSTKAKLELINKFQ